MAASQGFHGFVRLAFHLVIFTVYLIALYWDNIYVAPITKRQFAGRWKYLTFLNELLQTIYFGIATLNDVVGTYTHPGDNQLQRSGLQKLRDIILTSLAFPMGTFVVVSFWGIYAIDRELVFPKALDAIFPSWLNHIMHTTVIVFLLVEMFLVYHPFPRRRKGLTLCLSFAATYQVWIFFIAFYANIWVYPILAVLSWPSRFGFLAVCWALVVTFFMMGEVINNTIWGAPPKRGLKKSN